MICEAPKLGPFRDAMRERLAGALGLAAADVNVKFTTDEGMGFVGRGEGIAALATATVAAHGSRLIAIQSHRGMDRDDLAFAGAARQARMVRDGQVSSRELVELYLDRIERLDPELNTLPDRDGRAGAGRGRPGRRAPARRATSAPLLGVPIAVKDTEDVAGEVTRWGTAAFSEPGGRATASWCRACARPAP